MTKVKICGLTNLEDALVAVEAGADLLGFIFHRPSPRYVTPERVTEIVSTLRAHRPPLNRQLPTFIGVFVNTPLEMVIRILDECQLDAAQLHGDEPPDFVHHFGGRAFKAIRPQSPAEAEALATAYQPLSPASLNLPPSAPPAASSTASECWSGTGLQSLKLPALLLDAYHPALYGGTGQVTDWTTAAQVARRYPVMLAGSLTPANVEQAIRLVRPWGVDVGSGVEIEPGKKDHDKVRAFVERVKKWRTNQ